MSDIPYYGIYGDAARSDDPEFLHIEKMGERALAMEGRAAPHVHRNMFQILFALKGQCSIEIEDSIRTVSGTSIVYIPGNTVHSFSFDTESVGWVITASERLFVPAPESPTGHFFGERLWRLPAIIPYQDDPQGIKKMCWLMEQIDTEFQGADSGRSLALESLVKIALINIRRKLFTASGPVIQNDKNRDIFLEFRRLLEQNFCQHLSLDNYAGLLKVNPSRLKKACLSFTDKSPHELIQNRLILEAQRLLIYTSASAVQISSELGFQDPAYFSRFIKRRLGLPPLEFRRQKQREHSPENS